MNTLNFFYAVSRSGQGCAFTGCPYRNEELGVWNGQKDLVVVSILSRMESKGFYLPNITWEDAPVELKLSLTYG